MNRTLKHTLAAMFLAGTGTFSQATLLSDLISQNGKIVDGDKEFYGFSFTGTCIPGGSIGFCAGQASGIDVQALAGAATGLAFIGQLSVQSAGGAGNGTHGDFFIAYNVRVLDPLKSITSIGLSFNGSLNGNQSNLNVTETVFSSLGGSQLGQAVVFNPPATLSVNVPLSQTFKQAYVTKDIAMNAGNTIASPGGTNDYFATLSLIHQIYDQTESEVPEPGTMALAGAALLALGAWRKRNAA